MKRAVTIAVAGATILAAGLSGCSGGKSSTGGSGSSSVSATSGSGGGGGASGPKVLIDGQDQHVTGSVVCQTVGGTVNIAIGGSATGIGAVLSDGSPPDVKSVALGNVNGVSLGYTSGTGQGKAEASKNGNSYKISGTATGLDMANPTQPVNKPFEIDVTCA
ncbi:lipoprotein LpqH [Mycobacterium sp. 1423905.2]|uniref:lipoprotein LpqH n=1 Tax=Mycobacterium sp. 1423905.2 TaxID=1856859 RepID=UPI00080007C9|nr:lipoprotein LpqH [Mycobacterium sp. 1423905.2]OBJ61520.1 hypothetical protein A9W95_09480 [Mycobacterium sp. 1423905.2]